jgi:hypothetical protein
VTFHFNAPMSTGWQCPQCQAVHAPWVASCMHCAPRVLYKAPLVPLPPFETGDRVKVTDLWDEMHGQVGIVVSEGAGQCEVEFPDAELGPARFFYPYASLSRDREV